MAHPADLAPSLGAAAPGLRTAPGGLPLLVIGLTHTALEGRHGRRRGFRERKISTNTVHQFLRFLHTFRTRLVGPERYWLIFLGPVRRRLSTRERSLVLAANQGLPEGVSAAEGGDRGLAEELRHRRAWPVQKVTSSPLLVFHRAWSERPNTSCGAAEGGDRGRRRRYLQGEDISEAKISPSNVSASASFAAL